MEDEILDEPFSWIRQKISKYKKNIRRIKTKKKVRESIKKKIKKNRRARDMPNITIITRLQIYACRVIFVCNFLHENDVFTRFYFVLVVYV